MEPLTRSLTSEVNETDSPDLVVVGIVVLVVAMRSFTLPLSWLELRGRISSSFASLDHDHPTTLPLNTDQNGSLARQRFAESLSIASESFIQLQPSDNGDCTLDQSLDHLPHPLNPPPCRKISSSIPCVCSSAVANYICGIVMIVYSCAAHNKSHKTEIYGNNTTLLLSREEKSEITTQ